MSDAPPSLPRRQLLAGVALTALSACAQSDIPTSQASAVTHGARVTAVPLTAVRLKPSPFLTSVEANRAYLHRLEPDRLLHNFREQAGLSPKGEAYTGWEADTIAGHSLGHYLTACALMHAQTGDEECKRRALYIVDELAACQGAGGDGYVAGFTRKGEAGRIEPGRVVLDELSRGDIRPARFYLNGCWVPFYNWHKLYAGLFAAQTYCGADKALPVAVTLANYIEGKIGRLSDDQIQTMLQCEHGGINESLAELHVRTGDPRWLALSQRIFHRAVLEPLTQERDELAFIHANTQIPKVIGLARLYEITGDSRYATASRYFWNAVTNGRSYVIGGNSDREYFQEPNSISQYITEQTCESCNTYNMMKLTRHLYAREPKASYFDYYERAHFNHILAQHRPTDGMFAYMVPLMSGSQREWSEPFGSFWCCVGSGMESHSKHGDSIYWTDARTLYVNLYIPSELDWAERRARISIDTGYPYSDRVAVTLNAIASPQRFVMALRAPAWCAAPAVTVNGAAVTTRPDAQGYFRIERTWGTGDRIELSLPMQPRIEATPDDPDTIALLNGPLVLAADLGPASDTPYDELAPALVSSDVLSSFAVTNAATATFESRTIGRPRDLTFAPFYRLHDRRTAVYFKRYTPEQWAEAQRRYAADQEAHRALDARSLDVIRLGVEADERTHNLRSEISYAVSYRRKPGRDARTGGFFEFDAAVRPGPLTLRATYWGGERDRTFHILVDGTQIATQRLSGEHSGQFFDVDYDIPAALIARKRKVRIRFTPETGRTAGPVFGCRIFRNA